MIRYVLFSVLLFMTILSCGPESKMSIDLISQDERPDGFVSDWSSITPVNPPPPAPFRLLKGDPINMNWAKGSGTGRENEVKVDFAISMGTVGSIDFKAGSGQGIAAATSNIEMAMNSWQFTNNGWGAVSMTLNFGSKQVALDFRKFNLHNKVEIQQASFYTVFNGRRESIDFK